MSEAVFDSGSGNRAEISGSGTMAEFASRPRPKPSVVRPPAARCDACAARRCRLRDRTGVGPCLLVGLDARIRLVKAGAHVILQGDRVDQAMTLAEGMAVVYRLFEDGRRQILRFAFPGDILAFPGWDPALAEYTVEALVPSSVCSLSLASLAVASSSSPALALSLAARLVRELDASWTLLAALGRQSARERLAMLLLTLHRKAQAAEPVPTRFSRLPLNLVLLADATGLTPVHVCRTLKSMRLDGLLEWNKGRLSILDPGRLAEIAQIGTEGEAAPDEGPRPARVVG